jgi:DNA primase
MFRLQEKLEFLRSQYFAMHFSDSFLDEIRARIPVSEIVKQRVVLKRQGREWRGLSPFNKEKTPSFFVNDQKGFYHDFSSGKSGDQFTFLMETEGLTFPEAVERLAQLAGMSMPAISKEMVQQEQKQKTLYEVVELATQFFEMQLVSSRGKMARDYAVGRGLEQKTIKEFRIGYAPGERFALKEYLGSKGVSVADMIETGLLVSGDDIAVPYDRFRDRLIIPIHDQRGRVIAFGGRALSSDVQAKYLNSPETALFHKGSMVFNFHRARQPAHDDGTIVVVEGYMDAIAIYQSGMKSVVASMGTAFTEEQIVTLWRLSEEPIVCFDADRAGVAAAHRSIDRILPVLKVGRTFRFAFLRDEKDPDDLIREQGLSAFSDVLRGSLPIWDVLWERETAQALVTTPDGQAKLEAKLNAIVSSIKDPVVRTAYNRTSRIQLANLFWEVTRKRRGLPQDGLTSRELKIEKEGHRHGLQKLVLGLLVHYPQLLDEKMPELTNVELESQYEIFRSALDNLLLTNKKVSVQQIYDELGSTFYEVLEEIHGYRAEGRQQGYRLVQRFPILQVDPPLDFVSSCIDHFVQLLMVEQIRYEIVILKNSPHGDAGAVLERVLALMRDLHAREETIQAMDLALAEQASEIKRLALGPTEYQRVAA